MLLCFAVPTPPLDQLPQVDKAHVSLVVFLSLSLAVVDSLLSNGVSTVLGPGSMQKDSPVGVAAEATVRALAAPAHAGRHPGGPERDAAVQPALAVDGA